MPSKQSNQSSEPEPKEVSSYDLGQLPKPELTGHNWRQQGTQLICTSCPFEHASYLEPGYQLYGIDKQGLPLIRKY
jgi:hypothetical protein